MTDNKYGEWGVAVEAHKLHPRRYHPWVPWVAAFVVIGAFVGYVATSIHTAKEKATVIPLVRDPDIGVVSAGDVPLSSLRVGDCIIDEPRAALAPGVGLGRCDQNHLSEVVGLVPLTGSYAAGRTKEETADGCRPLLAHFSAYVSSSVAPTKDEWSKGARSGVCLVFDSHRDFLVGHVQPQSG